MGNRFPRRVLFPLAITLLLLAAGSRAPQASGSPTLADPDNGQVLTGTRVLQALQPARLILVGEHHTDTGHHRAQLAVIRFLDSRSVPLAIGLEMFRKDQQPFLDQWVAGTLDEKDFETIYMDNWNFPWTLYRDIFVYAREHRIPMVGLNVSQSVTRQVARHGFASLSDDQRGELAGVTCNVTREYRDFIRSAFGAHGHGSMNFVHFCEAQLVWDTAMALNARDYLTRHPGRTMVLLAGSGHARKMGIPYQFGERSAMRSVVLLPYTPDIFTPEQITRADADYLIMP